MATRMKPTQPVQPDLILKYTGQFGKFQVGLCALCFLCKFAIGAHQMAIIFLAPKMTYRCGEDANAPVGKCPCDNPVFNTSVFKNNMITEFKLICGRKWLVALTQTIFQLGTLIGSVGFGMASDRWGRRLPMIAACMIQIVFGILAAFTETYEWFTLFRFLVGLSVGGTMVISFVIIMEFIGPAYRETISAIYQIPFNVGLMLLPVAAYFFRDYRDFQLVISTPEVIFVIYICFLPETPRWLVAVKQTEKAIKLLEHVAKVNGLPTDTLQSDIIAYQNDAERNKLRKGTIADLFRTPNLRKNTLAMAYNWLACSYCFYGVSQYVGQLSGDTFLNVACSATVSLLGTLLSIPLMKWFGRKTIVIIGHCTCAGCLLLLAFLPEGIASVFFACLGVISSLIVFLVAYLYCGELFPTVVRNAAVGFSSMSARIGSMLAPFVIELRDFQLWIVPLVFAILPLFAIFITLLLPETKGCQLMTTIDEAEEYGKKSKEPK